MGDKDADLRNVIGERKLRLQVVCLYGQLATRSQKKTLQAAVPTGLDNAVASGRAIG